jgi:hypothetical protein
MVLSGAVDFAVRNDLMDLDEQSVDVDSLLAGLPWDRRDERRGAQAVGGSIFEAKMDVTHPLAFGMTERLPVFHTGSEVYDATEDTDFVLGRYADEPVLSGYVSEEFADILPGSVSAASGRYGRGRVTVFMDRLNFRAFWYGTQRLFMNAAVIGHSL